MSPPLTSGYPVAVNSNEDPNVILMSGGHTNVRGAKVGGAVVGGGVVGAGVVVIRMVVVVVVVVVVGAGVGGNAG